MTPHLRISHRSLANRYGVSHVEPPPNPKGLYAEVAVKSKLAGARLAERLRNKVKFIPKNK